ncbi:GNAT family N-acetyltransferase [Rhodovulum steppense]|uniref:Acetyltransferase (GNAT) family protein n=1 Tax=Rhodovulum steppense TaxID=540251 RepID=A0A4R1YUJ2_9RHOB|nr:GNAT family N-acetyltransferase [Rhodovulum steppense]TCM84759.1 acetyltransferase (GNAT) family protein [Rhodovulum steppense]
MSLDFRVLTGPEVEAALDDLAALRIRVFRDWPYLYDGDPAYERRYLASYRDNPRAILVVAFDGGRIVGASTGTPLEDHADDFAAAFAGTGYDLAEIFYCAESVLLPEYRGQGAGHAFFAAREDHGRRLGRRFCTFCSVLRPADHPLKSAAYSPLDAFWTKRGYERLDAVVAQFEWKDIDQPGATSHDLQFWIKPL